MKTKEEEKRIIDSYNTIFQQIIKNRPEICGLVDDTDNYIKHLRGMLKTLFLSPMHTPLPDTFSQHLACILLKTSFAFV